MKKFAKSLILILLALALIFAIAGCNTTAESAEDTDSSESDANTGSGAVPVTEPIDKTAVFSRITSGLTLADSVVAKQKVRHVSSCYEVIVNQINITVTYEADYNFDRPQDSEIMLKLFDNQYECNTVFLYYYSGTLYYEYDGEKSKIENFGGTSTFEVFFDLVQSFDMESYFFTEDFADTFSSMSLFTESSNMTVRSISETEERIEIKDVNMDRAKNNVNKFIKQMFGTATLGTKLDALSSAILGFKLSDIGEVEIGLFNASNIQIIIRDDVVTDFDITFAGTQSNNVSTYYLDISYSTTASSKRVSLDKYDSPSTNVYKESRATEQHYSGQIYVPALDTDFNIDIYADITTGDNSQNKLLVDVRTKTDEALQEGDAHYVDNSILYLYYINGNLYINADGLIRYYIGNGVDLKSLGFPTVYSESLNVSQQLGSIATDILTYLQDDLSLEAIMGSIDFDWEETTLGIEVSDESLINPETPLGILLANCSSDGDVFTVTIDDDFIGTAMGDYETDIVEWLATQIGLDRSLFEKIVGEDFFKDITVTLTIDMSTGDITLDFVTAQGTLFTTELHSEETPDTGIVIPEPKHFNAEEYTLLEVPEDAALHLEGEIRMQGKSEVDLSAFFGAFIGDVTGVNTPYSFAVNDRFYLDLDVWTQNDLSYIQMYLWDNPTYTGTLCKANITSEPFMTIHTSTANDSVFLIDFAMVGYKYQMPREGLMEAFNDLLGEDNLYSYENIMEILRMITSHSKVLMNEDHIAFTLAPYTENGVTVDPIFEYLGVDSLIADMKAQVKFTVPTVSVSINSYSVPEFEALQDLAFASMYEAYWHEDVNVSFYRDNATKVFKLSFIGESAKLVTGKYYYLPEAKLFGDVVSYAMVLTDTVNGTKAIDRLESSKLTIDPSIENAIPEKIKVIYDDGTLGEQYFTIVGFPYTNENINMALKGETAKNYEVIIGDGSINEVRFTLPIEILNRVVLPYEFRTGIPANEPSTDEENERWDKAYIGNVPVVKTVTIDPYEYSLIKLGKKAAPEDADPQTSLDGTTLSLYFERTVVIKNEDGTEDTRTVIAEEKIENFIWDFDESLITYRGGAFYVYAYYNTIKIAMRVNVTAKVVDYIQIVGERPANYTVDSLIESSYNIPKETDDRAEVRIYFKTGNYRIIGTEPEGYEQSDPYCDGYYPIALNWEFPKATNVSLDSTINPLNYGLTNIDTTEFGDNVVGKQGITLTVYSPSRRLTNLADNVHAITKLAIDAITGDIKEDETVRESVRVSSVGLGSVGGTFDYDGAYFILDPYATGEGKRLPTTITMEVEYAGVKIRRAYNVEWVESTIIDAEGYIKNPTADENLLMATGWIGETSINRQLVTIIIHNLSGKYDSMIIVDPNTGDRILPSSSGEYVISINPYDDYKLPTSFSLEFMEEDGTKKTLTYDTDWQIDLGNGEEPLPEDYQFSYKGGEFVITTYVEASAAEGILAQKVDLTVAVLEKIIIPGKIYGLSSEMTPQDDSLSYFTVDPYVASSATLEATLKNNSSTIGVSFKDGTKQSGGIPVEWDNLDEVLSVLNSEGGTSDYPSELITLTGKVHKYSEALEQAVSVSLRVLKKEIRSMALTNLTDTEVENGVVDVKIDIKTKTIDIEILKPFILSAGEMGDQVAPSVYVNYLFSAIRIAFEDDSYGTYDLDDSALPDNFDIDAFTYGEAQARSLITFTVPRLSKGSRTENYTVNVYTVKDELISDAINESIETFEANGGTPLYTAGYDIPSSIEVEFKYSGKVTYTGLTWYSKSNYSDDTGVVLKVNEPVPDQNIPSSLFKTMTGSTIWLYTKLNNANNKEINKTFIFYAKDIKETLYDAEADDQYYTIRTGTINVDDIYNVYPFDVTKLPKTIVPHTGNLNTAYQIEHEIRFGVTWIPTAEFARDDDPTAFDQDKINSYFNYMGYGGGEDEIFATAEIRMYGSEVQIIKLYVNVAQLTEGKISHEKLTVDSQIGDIAGEVSGVMRNSVVIDPYEDNFGGNYVLPHDITVTFDRETFTFASDANIKYQIKNTSGNYVDITAIPYTHLGHKLGLAYGAATDTLYLHVILPDGQILYLDITFNSREFQAIYMPNKATKVEGGIAKLNAIYYIDPYDADTYQVPMTAEFAFLAGDNSTLNISYWNIAESGAPFNSAYRFVTNGNFYGGGTYTFNSSLSGYGVAAQEFTIKVVVLDRSLATREAGNSDTPYKNVYNVPNPIAAVASDIPTTLTESSFVELNDSIYDAYNNISAPVLPAISWKIKNDDLVYSGMNNVVFSGNVKYGSVAGEVTSIAINAPKWEFARIDYVQTNTINNVGVAEDQQITCMNEYIINFNPTGESIAKKVIVCFYVNDNKSSPNEITFYPLEHADEEEYDSHLIIDWGDTSPDAYTLRTFSLGNADKSLRIQVDKRYFYRYSQVPVTHIDFGYGLKESGYVEFVIDPLNPIIPSEVEAWGREPNTVEELRNLGNIAITWDSSVYDYTYTGLLDGKIVEVTLHPSGAENVKFNVIVYYLDRTPIIVETSSEGYSERKNTTTGKYTLYEYNRQSNTENSLFSMSPVDKQIYDEETNKYIMPADLVYTFRSSYTNSTLNAALKKLGYTFTFTNMTWSLSKEITLAGTYYTDEEGATLSDPIITTIVRGNMSYVINAGEDNQADEDCGTQIYPDGMPDIFKLRLNVENHEVEYTSISEKITMPNGTSYQKALSEYFIDPYETGYSSSFPMTIKVKYTGVPQEQTVEIKEWIFDEEYLKRPDVISGLILENGGTAESMTVMAKFAVFGTTIAIQFPIKARNIVTTLPGGEGTIPISGGTIYVLKDKDLRSQLPTYMYYKFEYDGDMDVTPVPLTFTDNNLFGVSTAKAGVSYTVLGTLGGINVDNIEFTVTVIDPQVFTTRDVDELITKGSFYYDYIQVARNTSGFYTVGKEASLLPKRIFINDDGDYLSVESISYSLGDDGNGFATFNCKYIFNRDASLYLSGNAIGDGEGSDQLAISFTVPVKSYDYTVIDSTMPLTFNETEYMVNLGNVLKASDMPTAFDDDGNVYSLIWDMSDVDTNLAGTYIAYGYYLNNAAKNNVVALKIIVKQHKISDTDISISRDWTNRTYVGKEVSVDNYLTISTFLRKDGTIDKVEGYSVLYSVDEGVSWQEVQPIRVGSYKVKITIEDYNIIGSKVFDFVITKATIPANSITFHETEDGPAIYEDGVIVYSYSGDEIKPVIKGIIDDINLEYQIVYEKRTTYNYTLGKYNYEVVAPVNVGIYKVSVIFPDQRDYYSSQTYTLEYEIVAKDVVYSIQREMVYNGLERDVVVNGLPQNPTVAGVKVTYTYYSPSDLTTPLVGKVKNAGTYLVTVEIDGGANYPSANANGVYSPNLIMYEFKILPKEVIVNVGELETEYLEDILPLYSAVTITDADNPSISGLQGSDTVDLFLAVLNVYCPDVASGKLTNKHMVNDRNDAGTGGYNLVSSVISASKMPSNYTVDPTTGYKSGKYYITATNGAKVISNKLELDNAVAQLRDNQEVKWYLRNGSYGTITINKNATVSIVGSYDLTSGKTAVDFTSINVVKGGVTIDIVNFKAVSKSASVTIGEDATSVTINRAKFVRSGSAYLTGSIAVSAAPGFDGMLTMTNSTIYGYTVGIYLRGGSLTLSDSTLDSNIIGVQVQDGNMVLLNNTFCYNRSEAVYNTSNDGDISINDNTFIGNAIGVKSLQKLMNDIVVQNTFSANAKNTYQI